MHLPPLYAIADFDVLTARGIQLHDYAADLRKAGVALLQYRHKSPAPQIILRNAAVISEAFAGTPATLIMNDRADLALLARFTGVHVGQDDLSPEDVRIVLGPGKIVGISTHIDAQVVAANTSAPDYIAIGPVFATSTKFDADPVVGLQGVRRARKLTASPLVAIGGINLENARSAIDAGADSVAVISGLLIPGLTVEQAASRFLKLLE